MATETVPARTLERQAFYDRIAPATSRRCGKTCTGWLPPSRRRACLPAIWRYRDVRPHLMESGGLITAQEATRRVLMLMNPGLGGEASITGSLFAGLQLIMPGEIAAAHRHSSRHCASSSRGTAPTPRSMANGPRCSRAISSSPRPGPGRSRHETEEPMVWLDGLDIRSSSSWARALPRAIPRMSSPSAGRKATALARFGHNLLPVDWKPKVKTSPVFNYPYVRTREALDALSRNGVADPYHATNCAT